MTDAKAPPPALTAPPAASVVHSVVLLVAVPADVLRDAIRASDAGDALFARLIRAQVGRRGLKETLRRVRRVMADEALARCGGNRSAIGRVLGIDRSYVRKLLGELART